MTAPFIPPDPLKGRRHIAGRARERILHGAFAAWSSLTVLVMDDELLDESRGRCGCGCIGR